MNTEKKFLQSSEDTEEFRREVEMIKTMFTTAPGEERQTFLTLVTATWIPRASLSRAVKELNLTQKIK